MKEIREYATKHGIKLTQHHDQSVTIKHSATKRTASINEFMNRFNQPLRKLNKLLEEQGYCYISSPQNFKYSNYPEVKAVIRFERVM